MSIYNFQSVVTTVVLFECAHLLFANLIQQFLQSRFGKRLVPDQERRAKLVERGPAYLVSTMHAFIVTFRGLQHVFVIFRASKFLKTHIPSELFYTPRPNERKIMRELHRVERSNLILTSYFLSDLHHVLINYPNIGGIDTVLHHLAFLYCSFIGGAFKLNPFMFCWLILGEASTPFLNLRWLIINSGYGHTLFLRVVELIFALVFFVARFALYGLGVIYQTAILPNYPPHAPAWAIYSTYVCVVAGFFINLVWLKKIFKIVVRAFSPHSDHQNHSPISSKSD